VKEDVERREQNNEVFFSSCDVNALNKVLLQKENNYFQNITFEILK
jgi:hypothetical protein